MELKQLVDAVINGQMKVVTEQVNAALAAGVPVEQILTDGLIMPMQEVGRRFECGEYYVPEMLISARAMKSGLEILRPHLAAANIQAVGKVVIGTMQGDLHDIGKNLVAMMLEGAGFEVVDLGVDVSPATFVEAVKTHHPHVVGMSALLTTTMPRMKQVVEALNAAGVRETVKVMIGGAPVTEQYAKEIGADIYAPDASVAATRAKEGIAAG